MIEFLPYLLLGIFISQLKHFAQAWKAKHDFSWVGYWTNNLDTTITSIVTALTTYITIYAAGDMNLSAAILAGLGGNSIAGFVGNRNKELMNDKTIT